MQSSNDKESKEGSGSLSAPSSNSSIFIDNPALSLAFFHCAAAIEAAKNPLAEPPKSLSRSASFDSLLDSLSPEDVAFNLSFRAEME